MSYGVGVRDERASAVEGTAAADDVDAQLAALLAAADGPVNWRNVASANASDRWSELRDWVGWFRSELAFDHRVVPPCWYRHPALVSLLSALRDHWQAAYDESGSLVGPSDWHRALAQLEPRLREWASRTGCTAGAHRPDVTAPYPDDADAWRAHVEHDVAARAERERGDGASSGATRRMEAAGSDDD